MRPPQKSCSAETPPMRSLAALFAALIVTACASAGATLGSGVGDRQLEHPPWYAGRAGMEDTRIARLPIAYQRGASQANIFDPANEPESPVATLVRKMN